MQEDLSKLLDLFTTGFIPEKARKDYFEISCARYVGKNAIVIDQWCRNPVEPQVPYIGFYALGVIDEIYIDEIGMGDMMFAPVKVLGDIGRVIDGKVSEQELWRWNTKSANTSNNYLFQLSSKGNYQMVSAENPFAAFLKIEQPKAVLRAILPKTTSVGFRLHPDQSFGCFLEEGEERF